VSARQAKVRDTISTPMTKTTVSAALKGRLATRVFFWAVGAIVLSCGGSHAGTVPEAGDARTDIPAQVSVDGGFDGGLACQPSSDAAEPELPTFVIPDGGVPLDRVGYALAVARCRYWGRCTPYAPYVVSECVEALSQASMWNCWTCGGGISYPHPFPSAALVQAVAAGIVRYDPDQESACLQALQAQTCHGYDLWETVPACAKVFSCPPDANVGDGGSSDGGAVDGGESCSSLLEGTPAAPRYALLPCSTSSDCAGAAWPGGPSCVDGSCVAGPCGLDSFCGDVAAGQPCNGYITGINGSGERLAIGWTQPSRTCLRGLTCIGLTAGGGLGVCAPPQDIGGPCAQDTINAGCLVGLVCQCGTCQLPPSRGPCASNSCQTGVAYCDLKSNTCLPVQQVGGDCTVEGKECPPNLKCDNGSCERYSPQ
jgi:hypothetical protein